MDVSGSHILAPYVGTQRVPFSTSKIECEKIFGTPVRLSKTRGNELKLVYDEIEFIFSMNGSKILEMLFRPNVTLLINNIDIFHDKTALSKLSKIDSPLEYAGILFFPALGISSTGLHNKDDVSVTAIAKGRFDKLVHNFQPYKAFDVA
ncbi:hypothetical protein NHH88_16285 [Oxalobacteraceae bacterium OTU3CAMAD1]|nr:hypothetical protein NHH88_16285 [Oxalobacteraceae bacterium OTU3CAMAD1]